MFKVGDRVKVSDFFFEQNPLADKALYADVIGIVTETEEISRFWGMPAYEVKFPTHEGDLFEPELVKAN